MSYKNSERKPLAFFWVFNEKYKMLKLLRSNHTSLILDVQT